MNFFKSVFSDDPDPQPESGSANPPPPPEPSRSAVAVTAESGGAWNFGGLMKTLTSKSESIIETYRRDLREFGTGLKKEIEVAQGSLDDLGSTVAKGTAQIISKGKDAILAVDPDSSDSDHSNKNIQNSLTSSHNDRYYSRFDAAVLAVQCDASTYCDEPEDLEEYENWKRGFSIEGRSEEMERLLKENEVMGGVYKSVVPDSVDHEGFWFRYYYKVYRIKKAEDLRARIVRGMEREDDEEDLSWDVDDDDDYDDKKVGLGGGENVGKRMDIELRVGGSGMGSEEGMKGLDVEGLKVERRESLLESKGVGDKMDKYVEGSRVEELGGVGEVGGSGGESKESTGEGGVGDGMSKLGVDNAVSKNDDSAAGLGETVIMERKVDNAANESDDSAAGSGETVIMERKVDNSACKNDDSAAELDEKVVMERKGDGVKSSDKSNESSVVNADKEDEEEDLEWDDIEDLSSIGEKKATQSGSTNTTSKVDLRKRLSAAEEEEDLSWDIEDDEPAKA